MEHATGVFDQGALSVYTMPDEIDGDDRLGVTRRTGLLFNSKLVSNGSDACYSLDESMFIDAATSYDDFKLLTSNPKSTKSSQMSNTTNASSDDSNQRHRRYSIIGNDPSFKQYTKNHDYDNMKYT